MSEHVRLEDLRRRIEKDPASIAFAQLAEECRRSGLYQEAIDVCRRGLAQHPTYHSARVTLGRALLHLGELDEAQRELEAVLHAAPQHLAAIRASAELLQRRGALPEALAQYRAALVLSPHDMVLERMVAELSESLARVLHEAENVRSRSQIAALDRFLNAVHVTRAHRSA